MQNLTHNDSHFTLFTVARGKNKIWGGELYTFNLNNQIKYTVMKVQTRMKENTI